jgi:hypothetical protein
MNTFTAMLPSSETAPPPLAIPRPPSAYSVVPAEACDGVKEEILGLMRSNFSWSAEADVWYRWAYEQSPYSSNRCWFVETADRQRIGFTALMPRRMQVDGRTCDVGQAANLNVLAEHRGTAAAVKLQRAVTSHVDGSELAFAFGITRNAVAVQCRAGYRDLGTFSRWIKYFRTGHKLRARIPWSGVRRVVAGGLDLGLRLTAPETWRRLPAGWQVLHEPAFDERFDVLWDAAAPTCGITTERTSRYLNWRFGLDPQRRYQTLALQDERGVLRGYVVYLYPDPEQQIPFGAIVDLLAVDRTALDALLAALCSHLRRGGAHGVQLLSFTSPFVELAMKKCGFFRRESDYHLLVHLHPSLKPRETELLDRQHWHLIEAEAKF